MLNRILSRAHEELLKQERHLLGNLRVTLASFGATQEDQVTLRQSIEQLDEFFLLVVVGEFNAGKSAVINALLGRPVLEEGVTPTTTQINILEFGETEDRRIVEPRLHVLTAPVELLRQIHIVDTPGTNAIIREHEVITANFIPRSDLVLFVTSADRPFTESERAVLQQIRDWGKKIVVLVNKIDILETDDQVRQIQTFVAEHARALLGVAPEIFPVSARVALRAKQGAAADGQASGFEALERYIHGTLDQQSRIRLKLLNPLGVAARLSNRYLAASDERLDLLKEDLQMLEDVERQLTLYREDMRRDFGFRMADIENILLELEQRGQRYFDETMRVARVFDLLNKSRIEQGFQRQVVADTPKRVEQKVSELIDWLVDADFGHWQSVMSSLAERRRQYRNRLVGESETEARGFHFDRARLIDAVGRETQRVVETYDRHREAEAIAEGARSAVAACAAIEAGALGLGTLVTIITTTLAADVTGLLVASALAVLGFFIIPARRNRAKRDMREKLAAMRQALTRSLGSQFEQEMQRSLQRISDSMAPYARFVRAEHERLVEIRTALEQVRVQLGRLTAEVEAA